MLLQLKKSKFIKQQKGKSFNKISNNVSVNLLTKGRIGLKALDHGRISATQLITLKQTLNKYIKKKGRVFFNIFPHTPVTKKPIKVRMGKGKGGVDHYIVKVKPGLVLCEIETDIEALGKKALSLSQIKMPFKTKIIYEN